MGAAGMTTGICDMHCHILPKLDDGSKSMEETVRTVQEAVNQGIRTIIATPHFYPGRYETEAETVLRKVENVQLICQEQKNLQEQNYRFWIPMEKFWSPGHLLQKNTELK